LDFSKIEVGRMDLESVSFRVSEIFADIEKTFTLMASKKGVGISFVHENKSDLFVGDPSRLWQILNNLIGNAVKFTAKGSIEVRTVSVYESDTMAKLRFEVRDSGVGIPVDKQAQIFQPFRQADSSSSRRFGGSGLGLSISKKLVEMMGGSIAFESEPSVGSRFWVELELQRLNDDTSLKPMGDLSGESKKFEGHILVAEDNEVNQLVVRKLLEYMGYKCTAVSNGREVLDMLSKDQFDLILMDCQMPDLMAGMDDYLSKPIVKELLLKKIRQWQRSSSLSAERKA